MTDPLSRFRRFLRELKRRNVYKVAVAYLAVAFVGIQAAQLLVPPTTLPGWADDLLIYLAVFGFPIALVVAWAFEMTPEGMRRTPEAKPGGSVEEQPEPEAGTRTAYKVLIGLGLVAAAIAGGWYLTGGGGGESPEVTEGTVAVLPFQVSGSASEEWRDGMVSLVSTGLDGAAGLRAIPDQTVLATWEQTGSDRTRATVEQSLATARRIGARYGVVGTVTGLGSELQLSAAAYETTSGDRLGQVEVTGTPDSVTALAGELTRRVLGLLAAETGEGLEAADLASVTTRSDTALRVFLAGERHLRNADWQSAVQDYEAAIRADSGFALPYARLAFLRLWHGGINRKALERALELSDQLPRRSRRLVRALHLDAVETRPLAARDSLRLLTRDYPDDPQMWYYLGELIWHNGVPRGLPEVDRVLERAVELDPDGSYSTHLVHTAFVVHHDSSLAAERIARVAERYRPGFRLALDLAFGPPDDSLAEAARIDSFVDRADFPEENVMSFALLHPEDLPAHARVIRRLRQDPTVPASWSDLMLTLNSVTRGKIGRALRQMQSSAADSTHGSCILAGLLTVDIPVPDSLARLYLEPDTLSEDPAPNRLFCSTIYLINKGRDEDVERLIARLEVAGGATRDIPRARQNAMLREVRSYRAWENRRPERAAELTKGWSPISMYSGWRGDVYRELGQLQAAEGWYMANWNDPLAQERLGQLYEETGEPEKAAAAYRRFIAAWKDADEELQPRVEAVRKRLEELTASGAEQDE